MNVAKVMTSDQTICVGEVVGDQFRRFANSTPEAVTMASLFELPNVYSRCQELAATASDVMPLESVQLLPPIDQQEVWAAGVTYTRSKAARMEESESSASCYDRVYVSPRPELFLKATPHRVVGPLGVLRIRADAQWNVPEPELTLVMNSRMEWVGATIGNDMSSRDIEGDNPLYLPQAKVYDACCGLGPWVTLKEALPARREIEIELEIERQNAVVFAGSTDIGQMARGFEELIHWLGREQTFPNGVLLMTGTGVVPSSDFTLQRGDRVSISISGIGTLKNTIDQRDVEYQVPASEPQS